MCKAIFFRPPSSWTGHSFAAYQAMVRYGKITPFMLYLVTLCTFFVMAVVGHCIFLWQTFRKSLIVHMWPTIYGFIHKLRAEQWEGG